LIDLHSHTNESDGSCPPLELVDRALRMGLEALAISDHDTFAGYDQALPAARRYSLDLVCGIELSTRSETDRRKFSVHLLGYFLNAPPTGEFRTWLEELLEARRDRNRRLVAKLQSSGVDIELGEVESLGRTLTGRPHFARVLVNKGYTANTEEAFRKYLGESAPSFVERYGPDIATGIERINSAGGLSVVAHPVRLGFRDPAAEDAYIGKLREMGLRGIEVFHSDQNAQDAARYATLAKKYGLAVTGGSDFHGDAKPRIELGRGVDGNLDIPLSVLEDLRAA
jgi:predicted metal-dependent phosphoesterase TrpH